MKENNIHFWKNRKVLVTGYGGFVGTSLAEELAEAGAKVYVVVRSKNHKNVYDRRIKVVECDLTNAVAVAGVFKEIMPETIFHLAGFSIVGQALLRPTETFYDNFISTLNILDAMRKLGLNNFILASSDKVYGHHAVKDSEPLPFVEAYGLRGLDIYSSSKVCADIVSRAFAYQYGIKVAVARCCNIYGPGDVNFSRLIPRTAMLLLTGKSPIIKSGHKNILREYIYITDVVRAYMLIGQKLDSYYGSKMSNMPKQGMTTVSWPVFNIGQYKKNELKNIKKCSSIRSVAQVISVLQKNIVNIKSRTIASQPDYIEIPDEYSDSSKLINLGFKAQTDFDQGIKQTISWYRQNLNILKSKFKG